MENGTLVHTTTTSSSCWLSMSSTSTTSDVVPIHTNMRVVINHFVVVLTAVVVQLGYTSRLLQVQSFICANKKLSSPIN